MDYINLLEKKLEKKAKINFLPSQLGDVINTWANLEDLMKDYGYEPKKSIEKGITSFVDWYKKIYLKI